MSRLLPLLALGSFGCGGLGPSDLGDDDWNTAPTITGPTETTDRTWSFPPGQEADREIWRVDIRGSSVPGIPDYLWSSLPNELVFKVVEEDAPVLIRVDVGVIAAGSDPAAQDHCTPTTRDVEASSKEDGQFELLLAGEAADFGQPWTWDSVAIRGEKDPETLTIQITNVTAAAPATDLAQVLWGSGHCGDLEAAGLPCAPCESGVESCVKLELKGVGAFVDDFDLELMSHDDIALNEECW